MAKREPTAKLCCGELYRDAHIRCASTADLSPQLHPAAFTSRVACV
jgi:hypothetical protein